ncbi:MAG: tetratricopeptide repeat protein [Gammaproteobacteria bacterium]
MSLAIANTSRTYAVTQATSRTTALAVVRLVACVTAFVLGLQMSVASAAGSGPADPMAAKAVRDLYYGEALFQFYQDKHFDALTHLLVARSTGRVQNHETESELLLGGLYLNYGQHVRAEEIFNRLLTADVSPSVRDRAWFYLGKVRYQRGLNEDALTAFARISGELPASLSAELPMLKAQSLMALERFDEAATLLDNWKGPDGWLPYARYNLGVAFIRLNRLSDGARQLDRVGRSSPRSEELLDLRDKANLALGYAYLQQSLDGQARPVLARVRLASPFANKALLGVGWADAAAHNYRAALTPWLELKQRDLVDSAVQESMLAVPYAYAQLNAHGSAAEGYQAALVSFDSEIGQLDKAIQSAENGDLTRALLVRDDPGIGRWYWELEQLPDSTAARYLYPLIANNRFQEGLRNVRDLDALDGHLQEWRDKLAAFDDVVATRRKAYGQREPVIRESLDKVNLPALQARRDAVAARLAEIEAQRDIAGLGTDEELDRSRRLTAIGNDPGLKAADAGDLNDRYRLLKGVQLWNLDRDYKYRLWAQKRALHELDGLLAEATRRQADTNAVRRDMPANLDTFSRRIADVVPRIEGMQQVIARVRGQQEGQLHAMAVETLHEQRERLAAYRVQAQFALATIYDRAATAARTASTVRHEPEDSTAAPTLQPRSVSGTDP